ncbi:hypothetical protein BH23ACI1_BH23ACI1_13970 [soil metagenome]
MSTILDFDAAGGRRQVHLSDLLGPADEEQAIVAAHTWIKALRLAEVEGVSLRRRFTLRGDSLWWFAELYLHKQQVILQVCRTLAALERLVEGESPSAIRLASGGRVAGHVLLAFGRAHGIASEVPAPRESGRLRIVRMDLRARGLMLAALGSRLRPAKRAGRRRSASVAAFVHRAFWRKGATEGGAESYIGPVLEALAQRLPAEGLRYVGIGPPANFSARRWWHALRSTPHSIEPIEAFAPLHDLRDSRLVWRHRHAYRRALRSSADVREHAIIRGCDCWAVIREELAGVALLQWPWSARAMDEAAAALDALQPGVALTYAEAGGWGRALMLETRRRAIPSAGLQHGFIYRHWLNYLHEADEMEPDPDCPEDRGFPRPDTTLLFDDYAADHLRRAGGFPAGSLIVTGSPRLDALVSATRRLSPADIATVRAGAGARPTQAFVLVVTKEREARGALPGLVAAAAARPEIHLAIKTHPAETPDVYAGFAGGQANVGVLPREAPLAPLLAASRAVVTVNSTVALDAAVLGIPALVIGLPNNLSPFVTAGVMAGADRGLDIPEMLNRILYDDAFRLQLEHARVAFLGRFAIAADGRAAARSAEAVMDMMPGHQAERPANG